MKPHCSTRLLAPVMLALAAPCAAEQIWLSQGVSAQATDSLRFTFSNTAYIEHREHFSNEEAGSFRWTFAEHWAAGAGASISQDHVETGTANLEEAPSDDEDDSSAIPSGGHRRWDCSGRPTEHVALDWFHEVGGWHFLNSNRLYFYFREGERDWAVYRNIATVTAPAIPNIPWSPRLYLTQFIYVTDRDGYSGLDRINQFRWVAGLRVLPCEHFALTAYWQFRDIETSPDEWIRIRIVGLSANLLF